MSYAMVAIVVLGAGVVAGVFSLLARRLAPAEVLRRHHDIGSAVFLQLGVVFAVLLAFVFSEVWSEYNVAATAVNQECSSLTGAAILALNLPAPMRQQVGDAITHYVDEVISSEWPAMKERKESATAREAMLRLWAETAGLDVRDGKDVAIRNQILNLLQLAHQNRDMRLFEMVEAVPGLLWVLLISFAIVLVGFLFFFAIDYVVPQVLFTAIFTTAIAFVLVMVHLLDFPFEGALRLPPTDFEQTLQKVAIPAAAR